MNKYSKLSLFLFLIIAFLVQTSTLVKARVIEPNFPSCSSPQGTVKVSYESGTHGIVGSTSLFTGRDSVYVIDDKTIIQCFCPEDGQGIQTNWWKIDSLTQDEIDALKKSGWIFVPSGSVWGLDSFSYMAKNSDYDCGGGGIGGLGLGAGSVLGLAATGNSPLIYSLLILGFASILLGRVFRKNNRH